MERGVLPFRATPKKGGWKEIPWPFSERETKIFPVIPCRGCFLTEGFPIPSLSTSFQGLFNLWCPVRVKFHKPTRDFYFPSQKGFTLWRQDFFPILGISSPGPKIFLLPRGRREKPGVKFLTPRFQHLFNGRFSNNILFHNGALKFFHGFPGP